MYLVSPQKYSNFSTPLTNFLGAASGGCVWAGTRLTEVLVRLQPSVMSTTRQLSFPSLCVLSFCSNRELPDQQLRYEWRYFACFTDFDSASMAFFNLKVPSSALQTRGLGSISKNQTWTLSLWRLLHQTSLFYFLWLHAALMRHWWKVCHILLFSSLSSDNTTPSGRSK